jgi:hypothetical protein
MATLILRINTMPKHPLPPDLVTNIAFGIFMALLGLLGIWQAARYAAYRQRSLSGKRDRRLVCCHPY